MDVFITYEMGKKLKEKGYLHKYNTFGYRPIYSDECTIKFINHIGAYDLEYYGEDIPCPSIPEVLKWLREEKQIYVSGEVEHEEWFEYKIVNLTKNTRMNGTHVYKTYEKAIIAGIEYVLNNLI